MAISLEEFKKRVETAHQAIKGFVLKTPLLETSWLSKEINASVYLKMESEQITRSFKLRGATNKIIKMKHDGKKQVVTASSGNHGFACLHVASKLTDIDVCVYSYNGLSSAKEAAILSYPNARLVKYGTECCEAEVFARESAFKEGLPFISPYNDIDIAAGQGTIGIELLEQLPHLDAVFIPVGGGGLASGIATYLKAVKPSLITVGCQPSINCAMYDCIRSNYIKSDWSYLQDTLADGVAGGVEEASITFDLCKNYIDEWVLVDEEDIEKAVFDVFDKEKKVIEGAAGLTVAALRKCKDKFLNKNVALIFCGGNISTEKFKGVLLKLHK